MGLAKGAPLPLQEVVATLLGEKCDITKQLGTLSNRRVLLRADLNVPVNPDGSLADDTRVLAVLPTINMLLEASAKVIIISHFGRPQPEKQSWAEMQATNSLIHVAHKLAALLGEQRFTGLAADCIGERAEAAVAALQPGQAVLLENTRFHAGDTANSDEFARALGSLADVFVCDAFGVVHRDNASVTGITAHVPVSYPGPLIRHELKYLMQHMEHPVRPSCVILGGAKVADKIGVLESLIPKADVVLIGGRMAFTFLAAQGVSVGATQVETDKLQVATDLIQLAAKQGVQLLLPCDVRVSSSLDEAQQLKVQVLTRSCCSPDAPCLPEGHYGIDIGPASEAQFAAAIASCKTIFWNGPMGKFEVEDFSHGTAAVARAMAAASTQPGAITIVGGGDSVSAVTQLGLAHHMSHISTGGGASLELVEGKHMPGLRALLPPRA